MPSGTALRLAVLALILLGNQTVGRAEEPPPGTVSPAPAVDATAPPPAATPPAPTTPPPAATAPPPPAAAPAPPAPVCADGREITAETAGRCCWPGQAWRDDLNRCDGAPRCPPGWAGDGAGCVRVEAKPGAATLTPLAPAAAPATTTPAPPKAIPPRPATTTLVATAKPASPPWSPRRKLITASVVSLSLGYGLAAVASASTLAINNRQKDEAGGPGCLDASARGFIPIVGPLLYLRGYPGYAVYSMGHYYDCPGNRNTVVALAVTSTVLQVAGAAGLVAGLIWHPRGKTATAIALDPVGPDGTMGLGLRGRF
jgi:hypothetical protein